MDSDACFENNDAKQEPKRRSRQNSKDKVQWADSDTAALMAGCSEKGMAGLNEGRVWTIGTQEAR